MSTPASTVAERPSRPPGFDMSYQPEEQSFGPPWLSRLPSLVYLGAALCVAAILVAGEGSGSNSSLFDFVVVQDRNRSMGMRTFAIVLMVGGVASVLRAGMRGVRVFPGGVEARDIRNWFIPYVRRYTWPQLEKIILDEKISVAVDLWDGRREYLPEVNDRVGLEATLERVALARAIPISGGSNFESWEDTQGAKMLDPKELEAAERSQSSANRV
jgi:hypothetical protein